MIHSREKSVYVCPECWERKTAKPNQAIECDAHSKRVKMIETKKGVVVK